MIRELLLGLEDRRIATHLKVVESLLRKQTAPEAGEISRKRLALLDRLAAYGERGVFPRNDSSSLLTPVFVDAAGRECAVGHLIGRDSPITRRIAEKQNLARLPEIDDEDLDRWQRDSGLTVEELSLIQPQYATAGFLVTALLPGLLVMVASIVGAWLSHGLRRWRYRLDVFPIKGTTVAFSILAASSGWWLAAESLRRWKFGSVSPFMADYPGIAYEVALGVSGALGLSAVLFGAGVVVTAASQRLESRLPPQPTTAVRNIAARVARFTLGVIGALIWALGATNFGARLFLTSSVYAIGFLVAFAPLVWVIWSNSGRWRSDDRDRHFVSPPRAPGRG